jgi:plasmid stabilization system protein ParE
MALIVRVHIEAEAELLEAAMYYADRSADAGDRFLAAIDDVLAQVVAYPRSAPAWPGLPDVRRRVVTKYSYAVV